MRRLTALALLVLSLAVALPAAASPMWGNSDWTFLGRFVVWLSEVFEKEGSQADPWGQAQGSGSTAPLVCFDGRH